MCLPRFTEINFIISTKTIMLNETLETISQSCKFNGVVFSNVFIKGTSTDIICKRTTNNITDNKVVLSLNLILSNFLPLLKDRLKNKDLSIEREF